ncbi:sphingosine N-acyltransferase lag1 [Puccinia graminis f. sp. tritici]|uniref:Sphingosine N-acyltransferase lag1 n=1 Tax=Puccinia graminis f. sp. tritici TaxID=56615 RepID=A0A5B0M6M8_PUCGR|nr:sphingosine N-acyltransferase lag1 [Puccinia graminis f. sp. tritici]KAA1072006.1 sphingosine N-acyltransferase lag1 [Puccinia graminis f. sp. tritici]
MARTAPKKCADSHLAASFLVITATVVLNLAFPKLSDEPKPLRSIGQTTLLQITHLQNTLPKLIHLSYLNPETGKYHKGWDDLYFISFWVLIWLSLRELLMKLFWNPLGSWMGLTNGKKLQRFSEQGWTLVYCTVFWCMGIKILCAYPEPILSFNIRQYWQGYPHTSLDALSKFYYLSQIAFWFQQIVVLQVEKRRKDYYQMFAHHIVTAILVCGSYATNFTGIGTAVHTTMDLSDILLAFAKMLNYLKVGIVGDASFLVFVFSWIYTRHYVLLRIIFAIYKDLPQDIEFTWNPSKGQIASRSLWIAFLSLLSALEILLMIWLFMILKVLWKVVRGHAPEDTRSDTEDTDDEAGETKSRSPKIPVSCEKQPLLSTTDRPHRGPRRQQRK